MRRQEILQAAIRIFAEKGFERATLDEIAEAAEFGKGTIYNYFASKEELFFTLFHQGLEQFHQVVNQLLTQARTPLEKIEAYIDAAFDYLKKHEDHYRIISFEIQQPSLLIGPIHQKLSEEILKELQFLTGLIREGIQEDIFVDLDAQLMARALQGLIHSQACCTLLEQTPNYELSARLVKHVFIQGILKPERLNP